MEDYYAVRVRVMLAHCHCFHLIIYYVNIIYLYYVVPQEMKMTQYKC